MIENERDSRHEHVISIARQMMTAARTAPKGKGVDIIEVALITGDELQQLSKTMVQIAEETDMKFFLRDANNILQAECVVIIGTHEHAQGLNCGHCGFPTCTARPEGVPCATPIMIFNSLEPWSIILTFTFACANAEKILPAVPLVDFIPRPTTAISDKSDSISMLSGFASL